MGKAIEFLYSLGFGLTNATLILIYGYIVATTLTKVLYFAVNIVVLTLSIIRMKDTRNNKMKRRFFKHCAGLAAFSIFMQILVGYTPIQVMILEYVLIMYWASEGVILWEMIREEWESDWKPLFKLNYGNK